MEKPSVFISYSSKDRETAETLHQQLESSGFDVWRDKTRLETDWSREIAQALADSDVLCLLWSEQAEKSKWVKHEWQTARALEKTIILCRLPEARKSPEPLHNLQDVNLEDLEKGGQDLIGRLESRNDYTVKFDYTVLPKNSYIPFNPNPNFTGRGQDLLELYLKLIGNLNKIGINQVGTVGMGGIGKTQLVVEFAYRFSFAFDSVYWMQAADEGQWLRQFVELARDRLQLSINAESDKPEADKQYIYALQKYCKDNPDTLIIMDNVAEPILLSSDSFLFGLTPLTLGCDLLFTTRKHFELPGVSSQPVNILSKEGAYRLLASYRGPDTPDETEKARSICNAVGYLPLAIVLAGAFLKRYESETPFEDYHYELLKNKLDTIDIGDISDEQLATRHEAAVTTTLKNQWEMLDNENARILFKLAGQFPEAEIIPKARLGLLASIVPGKSKIEQPLTKAFNLLQDLNLVEKLEGDASAIRMHPLVRAFARQLLPEQQRATFKSTAAKNLGIAVFDYSRLQNELDKRGIKQLLSDIEVAIDWWGAKTEGLRELELLHGALWLSFHQLDRDSNLLTPLLFGRLSSRKEPEIKQLLKQAALEQKRVWLRPLTSSLTPPGGPLLRTIVLSARQRFDWNQCVAISSEYKTAVFGSRAELEVWDLRSGSIIHTIEGCNVGCITITPDGKTAVSGSEDGDLVVWDVHAGKVLQTLYGHSSSVNAVVIAQDGKLALSASDQTLKAWDVNAGKVLQTLDGASGSIKAVAITPDGKTALSASDQTLKAWDVNAGKVLHVMKVRSDSIKVVAITPDGKTALSGSFEGDLMIWDIHAGKLLQTLKGCGGSIKTVVITRDGKLALSASDQTLKVWDVNAGKVLQTLDGHSGWVNAVAINPDGKTAVSASIHSLKLWNVRAGKLLQTLVETSSGIGSVVAITPDGKTAVSGSEEGDLMVWDVHAGKVLHILKGHSGSIKAVAITPDGKTVASGYEVGDLMIWDVQAGKVLQTLKGIGESIDAVVITRDGNLVLSSVACILYCILNTLVLWDLRAGKAPQSVTGHSEIVKAVAITPDGKTAVSVSADMTLRVWNLHAGIAIASFYGESVITTCCISSDGRTIVAGEASGRMHFLRLEGMS